MKGMSQNSKAWNFQCTLVGLFGQNVLDNIVDPFVKNAHSKFTWFRCGLIRNVRLSKQNRLILNKKARREAFQAPRQSTTVQLQDGVRWGGRKDSTTLSSSILR